jgi:hypothetical protein
MCRLFVLPFAVVLAAAAVCDDAGGGANEEEGGNVEAEKGQQKRRIGKIAEKCDDWKKKEKQPV